MPCSSSSTTPSACRFGLALLGLLAACTPARAQTNIDARFGTAGPNNGNWQWSRFYNADLAAMSSTVAPDPKQLYTVGKLDNGNRTGLSGEDWCVGGVDFLKCDRSRQSPEKQSEVYGRIFQHDKAGIRRLITEFNRNFGSGPSENNYNGSQEIHISIGNEPNWHPYVHPQIYAQIFKRYYDYIKGPLPGGLNCGKCVVHNGGVILSDFHMVPAPETYIQVLLVWLEAAAATVANSSNRRLDYMTWTKIFLTELITGLHGRFDIFNVHPYEIDINWNGVAVAENGKANLGPFLRLLKGGLYEWGLQTPIAAGQYHCVTSCTNGSYYSMVDNQGRCLEPGTGQRPVFKTKKQCEEVRDILAQGRRWQTRMPWEIPNPVVWVDEFGLIKNDGAEAYSHTVMQNYVEYFKSQPNIHKWFWYKPLGYDEALFGNKTLRTWSLMAWESDKIALFQNDQNWTRTALGNRYLSLQDPAFVNHHHPRLSFDPPNLATHLNIARWTDDPMDYLKMWDFSRADDVNAWGLQNYQVYADGVKVNTQCTSNFIVKNLTASEIALAEDANYMVVEKGFRPPPADVVFQLVFRNKANPSVTVQKDISNFGNFSNLRNALADRGMPDVVEIAPYRPAGYELITIRYSEGVSGSICGPTSNREHFYSRVYLTVNNPVPVLGSTGGSYYASFSGVILEKEIPTLETSRIPVNLNTTHCSNCTLTLDGGSAAKGIQIEGQYLVWKPGPSQAGMHSGTLTVNIAGNSVSKKFNISVRKKKTPLTSFLSLLLN